MLLKLNFSGEKAELLQLQQCVLCWHHWTELTKSRRVYTIVDKVKRLYDRIHKVKMSLQFCSTNLNRVDIYFSGLLSDHFDSEYVSSSCQFVNYESWSKTKETFKALPKGKVRRYWTLCKSQGILSKGIMARQGWRTCVRNWY